MRPGERERWQLSGHRLDRGDRRRLSRRRLDNLTKC
jgi:hypothetical protein